MPDICDGQNPKCAVQLSRTADALERIDVKLGEINGTVQEHSKKINLLEDHDRYQENALKQINERHLEDIKIEREALRNQRRDMRRVLWAAVASIAGWIVMSLGTRIWELLQGAG